MSRMPEGLPIQNVERELPIISDAERLVPDDYEIDVEAAVMRTARQEYPGYPHPQDRLYWSEGQIKDWERRGMSVAELMKTASPGMINDNSNRTNATAQRAEAKGLLDYYDPSDGQLKHGNGEVIDIKDALHPYWQKMLVAGLGIPGFGFNWTTFVKAVDGVVLMERHGFLQALHTLDITRGDTGQPAFVGGMLEPGDPNMLHRLFEEFSEENHFDPSQLEKIENVYDGPAADPRDTLISSRETNLTVFLTTDEQADQIERGLKEKTIIGDAQETQGTQLNQVTEGYINSMFAMHPELMRMAIKAWQEHTGLVIGKDGRIGRRETPADIKEEHQVKHAANLLGRIFAEVRQNHFGWPHGWPFRRPNEQGLFNDVGETGRINLKGKDGDVAIGIGTRVSLGDKIGLNITAPFGKKGLREGLYILRQGLFGLKRVRKVASDPDQIAQFIQSNRLDPEELTQAVVNKLLAPELRLRFSDDLRAEMVAASGFAATQDLTPGASDDSMPSMTERVDLSAQASAEGSFAGEREQQAPNAVDEYASLSHQTVGMLTTAEDLLRRYPSLAAHMGVTEDNLKKARQNVQFDPQNEKNARALITVLNDAGSPLQNGDDVRFSTQGPIESLIQRFMVANLRIVGAHGYIPSVGTYMLDPEILPKIAVAMDVDPVNKNTDDIRNEIHLQLTKGGYGIVGDTWIREETKQILYDGLKLIRYTNKAQELAHIIGSSDEITPESLFGSDLDMDAIRTRVEKEVTDGNPSAEQIQRAFHELHTISREPSQNYRNYEYLEMLPEPRIMDQSIRDLGRSLMENPALNLARFARRTGTMLTYSTQLLYNTQLAALPYSRYIPLLDVFDKATQEAYQAFLDQDTGDGSLVNDKTRLNAAKSFATTVALENLPELLISILPQRPRIESDEIKQIIQGIGFTQEVGAVARYLERYIPNIESKALRFAQTLNTPEGRARAIQLLQVVVPESDYFYKRISEEELFSSSQSSTASSLPELDVVLAANQIARSTWQAGQAARARIEQNLGINANPVNRVTKDPVGDYMVVMLSDGARFQKRLALLQNGNWSAAELEELNLTEEKALEKRQKLAGLSVSPDEAFLIGATFFALKDFLALKKP